MTNLICQVLVYFEALQIVYFTIFALKKLEDDILCLGEPSISSHPHQQVSYRHLAVATAEANHPVALHREAIHVDVARLLPVHRSIITRNHEASREQHQRGTRRRLHRRRRNLPVTTGLHRRR